MNWWWLIGWVMVVVGALFLVLPFLITSKRADRRARAWKAFSEGKWQGKHWE